MTDNLLIAALIAVIQTGLSAQAITVGIQQSNQPTQQGVPSSDTVFLTKIGDNRYGWTYKLDNFDTNAQTMTHTETEWIETKFQVEALAIQNPANVVQLTAADYLKAVARTLQNETTINTLNSQGIGIYRIQAFKQTYFQDDKGRYESSPMFEFTVCHLDSLAMLINSTDTIVPNMRPVL